LPFSDTGNNAGATAEANEPFHAGNLEHSLWWRLQLSADATVVVRTEGSNFDTVLGVYTGTSLSLLTEVTSNDDSGGQQSQVSFPAQAGQIYHIAVDGFAGSTGDVVLSVGEAAQDVLSGRVTGPDGVTPLEGVLVRAENEFGEVFTDANGDYHFDTLAAGYHVISFNHPDYAVEFFNDRGSWNDADRIFLPGTGIQVDNVDASLSLGGSISGRVTASDGTTPLEFATVSFFVRDWWGISSLGHTFTDANGEYVSPRFRDGSEILVEFNPNDTAYAPEFYDDARTEASAAPLFIVDGQDLTGVDASLGPGGSISGTVTADDGVSPLEVSVDLYLLDGLDWVHFGTMPSQADGSYGFGSLPSGSYRLRFYDSMNQTYATIFYPDAVRLEDATDVVLASGQDLSGIDVSLPERSTLSGTVTSEFDGSPMEGVEVYVSSADYSTFEVAITAGDGSYEVSSLDPGVYRVEFFPAEPYVSEYYDGAWFFDSADLVQVPLGTDVANINASLQRYATLTGRVESVSGAPLAGAQVEASLEGVDWVDFAETDEDGYYVLDYLLPGHYLVKASALSHVDEFWSEALTPDDAAPLPLGDGQVTNLVFSLAEGQGPAYFDVTSEPSGAEIYLNLQPTGLQTPARLLLGQAPMEPDRLPILPHQVAVRRAGDPVPPPQAAHARESDVLPFHFDFAELPLAEVEVMTTPSGAEVFLDRADAPIGVTPLTVSNLIAGSHTILLRKAGHLLPRPVVVQATDAQTVQVSVPLAPLPVPAASGVAVTTEPEGAEVLIDYLPPTVTANFVVNWLDPASHAGSGWHSTHHVGLTSLPGFLTPAPFIIPVPSNGSAQVEVVLLPDVRDADDGDLDGLPDAWEDAYDLESRAPGAAGADDDPDQDFATNEEERKAGTNPLDPDSVFRATLDPQVVAGQFEFRFLTRPGAMYRVEYSEDLLDPDAWMNIGGNQSPFLATGSVSVVTYPLPTGVSGRAYRAVMIGQ
jgi:hypothetical protein